MPSGSNSIHISPLSVPQYKLMFIKLLSSKKLLKVVENNQYVWNIFVFPNVTSIYEEDKWDGDWMRKK